MDGVVCIPQRGFLVLPLEQASFLTALERQVRSLQRRSLYFSVDLLSQRRF